MAKKEEFVPSDNEKVVVLNHSMYRRTIDFGADKDGIRTVLTIPSGKAVKLPGQSQPGRVEITKEQWEAIKKHPTAGKMVRNGTLSAIEG